ncbi:hypothetical protein GB931_02965 [Modestobacter sp. I12A-02628]|uniref:VOC domain-containing protein n=1 Tax=Goekera deserti TaxID=2497753 RepID=A0A7K3WDC1_9ACTN|nr:VOC family protein [Goekera deserti]MPQ96899.1 hypothetical protein [Goekera deserti]NDI46788.1 hypothetical protein [Goekera deserti]NEL54357.1 hypothetical protein [Goekera deserti]
MAGQALHARARRPTGALSVDVPDLGKAVAYYQRFFGFLVRSQDEREAWLTGHGVTVRLSLAAGPEAGKQQPAAPLFVDRPAVLRRHLDDLGAHLVDVPPEAAGRGCFGVRDLYGNVLTFCPTTGLGSLRGALDDRVDRTRRAFRRRQSDRAQSGEVRRLREFLTGRGSRPPTFYVHVHGGLLHWLAATVGRLPADLDVVVIGSDLTADEQRWITTELRRPLHAVADRLDDAGALELLSAAEESDFGWVELGCLVLDPAVLHDLAMLPPDASLGCTWSFESGWGFPVAAPYLLYLSAGGLREVAALDPSATAGIHSWQRFNRQVEGRRCYSRVPSRRARRLLAGVVPTTDAHPPVPAGLPFYEATVLYQLLARAAGRQVHQVRHLSALGNARAEDVQDQYSDELVYIGALSYADPLEEFSGYFHDPSVRQLYLLAERVVLTPLSRSLPDWYQRRATLIDDALTAVGLDPEGAPALVIDHLVAVRGLTDEAAQLVVRPPVLSGHDQSPTARRSAR